MQSWIIEIMNQFGYVGIALLIAVENIFPPIPSEIILTFGGFMTTRTNLKVWGVILAATIGSVLGAIVLYEMGRFLSPKRLEAWLDSRWGRILHLKKGDISKACDWFEKRGKMTVFFCRCIPVIRSLISVPAGMAKMHMGLFLLMTTAGSLIWNVILVYLGASAGSSWEDALKYMETYSLLVKVILVVIALVLVAIFFKERVLKKTKPGNKKH